jgi:hypothetical protein
MNPQFDKYTLAGFDLASAQKPPATAGSLGMPLEDYRARLARIPRGLKALSIRQPWAWFIVRPDLVGEEREKRRGELKGVENRDWQPSNPGRKQRGRILIHASKGCTQKEYAEAVRTARRAGVTGTIPTHHQMERGGIIGMADIAAWVDDENPIDPDHRLYPYDPDNDPWFFGPGALVLREVTPLPFVPCAGMLGFFNPVFPEVAAS